MGYFGIRNVMRHFQLDKGGTLQGDFWIGDCPKLSPCGGRKLLDDFTVLRKFFRAMDDMNHIKDEWDKMRGYPRFVRTGVKSWAYAKAQQYARAPTQSPIPTTRSASTSLAEARRLVLMWTTTLHRSGRPW